MPGEIESVGKAVGDFFTSAVNGQQAQNSIDNYTGALANLEQGPDAGLCRTRTG